MKLRNKKTGEIDDFLFEVINNRIDLYRRVGSSDTRNIWNYDSLAELNKEWEDYKPAEPLIKDEKIRKAVRAWAEVAPSAQVRYDCSEGRLYTSSNYVMPFSISLPARLELDEMTDYTIAELCGEVEE